MYLCNGLKIYHYFLIRGPEKFSQIGIFGSKTNHLATLVQTRAIAARVCIGNCSWAMSPDLAEKNLGDL
jgi:hypothetical protein